ncbi:Rv0361 family membrane protein [Micromonospora avicenniae]|uniref:Rv0361 family membrane protein n=1 Tax=Micromonospora avicenniae TaxID=1198245 RepID=UPI003417A65C
MGAGQPWNRPARRHRPMRVGLVFAGVGVALCCIGVTGLGVRNLQVVTQAATPVRETADEFLRQVVLGDTGRAYDRLCSQARKKWSEGGFESWVRTPPEVRDYEIVDVSVTTRDGRPLGTVVVQLTRASGVTEQRELPVVREDGGWRVCGDPF